MKNFLSSILIALFGSAVASIIGELIASEMVKNIWLISFMPMVCIPIIGLSAAKNKKYDLFKSPYLSRPRLKISMLVYVAVAVIMLMSMSLFIGIISRLLEKSSADAVNSDIPIAVYYVVSCIIAPVTEEITFRLLLSNATSPNNEQKVSENICSAVLFTFMHGSIINAPYYFLLSFLTLKSVKKYNTIYIAIILHSLVNFIMLSLF